MPGMLGGSREGRGGGVSSCTASASPSAPPGPVTTVSALCGENREPLGGLGGTGLSVWAAFLGGSLGERGKSLCGSGGGDRLASLCAVLGVGTGCGGRILGECNTERFRVYV